MPFLAWVALYSASLYYFVPRLGRVARMQADARSLMTGRITDAYTNNKTTHNLHPGLPLHTHFNLKKTSGWYDFIVEVDSDPTFQQRIAGHLETGEDSMTDPAIAAVKR